LIRVGRDRPDARTDFKKNAPIWWRVAKARERIVASEIFEPSTPVAYAVTAAPPWAIYRMQFRGNPHTLGAEFPRGFVRVATLEPLRYPAGAKRSPALAEWLATFGQATGPSRVTVNPDRSRLYSVVGLFASVDYFGSAVTSHSSRVIGRSAARFLTQNMSRSH